MSGRSRQRALGHMYALSHIFKMNYVYTERCSRADIQQSGPLPHLLNYFQCLSMQIDDPKICAFKLLQTKPIGSCLEDVNELFGFLCCKRHTPSPNGYMSTVSCGRQLLEGVSLRLCRHSSIAIRGGVSSSQIHCYLDAVFDSVVRMGTQ